MRAGNFPGSVELGRNAIGRYEDEIAAWVDGRVRRAIGLGKPPAWSEANEHGPCGFASE